MRLLRSAKFSAFALFFAAVAGLAVANSALGPTLFAIRDAHFDVSAIGLSMSVGHWITDGLLAVFFFLAAIELKHELRHGELDSPRKALIPAIAAVGGVVVPAIVYLLIAGVGGARSGWPIPTATDIAFALGVLALVGTGLPDRVRALLLALAVIDDLIAILIIAVVFPGELEPVAFLVAIPVVLVFGALSYRVSRSNRVWMIPIMIVLGLIAWALVAVSGIHPTIAGVALGLALSSRKGAPVRHALEPWSNAIILPLFAFTATLVVIPDVTQTPLGAVFWAILIALPLGKIVGITGGALVARSVMGRGGTLSIPVLDLLAVASLGGIGFTVSLLMNELAFEGSQKHLTEGTLGVLAGSLLAIAIGGTYTALRARSYRRR